MKIHNLVIENTKRVKAVTLSPAENGLTVIGGRNGQGKTSVLDAIAFALGGEKYRPSGVRREGSAVPPYIKVTLDNGLVVERKGKNSALTVTDPSGGKAGQQLLNEFIGELALDLPKFMQASDKEKAKVLLKLLGIGDKLNALDTEEAKLYNERLALGRIAEQKLAMSQGMPGYPDAPKEPVSASELIRRQQNILARNGENQRKREQLAAITREKERLREQISRLAAQLDELVTKRNELDERYIDACKDEAIAKKTAESLRDEATDEIERDLLRIDEINRKVRANLDKQKAEEDAREATSQYNQLTAQIDGLRKERASLLSSAPMPLDGLSVENGCLTYHGAQWDCMSGSEQLRVATAIVRALNPKCGFVLMDKLEQMDRETLAEFGEWLEENGLQVIATRVSTGEECQIIIEDGRIAPSGEQQNEQAAPAMRPWTKGAFGK